MGISNKGMRICLDIDQSVFLRLCTVSQFRSTHLAPKFNSQEIHNLIRMGNLGTVTAREVQTAVRLVYPGEVAKHGIFLLFVIFADLKKAVSEGTKAVTKYNSSMGLSADRPMQMPSCKKQKEILKKCSSHPI